MGIYVNPKDVTKEEWLSVNAVAVHEPEKFDAADNMLPVCLVDNGRFTAAGVCDSQDELQAFKYPDGRPRVWFLCSIDKLKTVTPESYHGHLDRARA